MSGHICLRCLSRPLAAEAGPHTLRFGLTSPRLPFSTSAPAAAVATTKKKGHVTINKHGAAYKQGRANAKGTPAKTGRGSANSGERKALRKRIVLSNTNALEVQGLQDMTADNMLDGDMHGQVLGLSNDSIDALRAAEAFKHTQGWSLFRKPATLMRAETQDMARLLQKATDDRSHVIRQVIYGERGSGKSVLTLQVMAAAFLKGWVVVHVPDGRQSHHDQAHYLLTLSQQRTLRSAILRTRPRLTHLVGRPTFSPSTSQICSRTSPNRIMPFYPALTSHRIMISRYQSHHPCHCFVWSSSAPKIQQLHGQSIKHSSPR